MTKTERFAKALALETSVYPGEIDGENVGLEARAGTAIFRDESGNHLKEDLKDFWSPSSQDAVKNSSKLEPNAPIDYTCNKVSRASIFGKGEASRLLGELFPNGHRLFIPIALEEIELHSKKNHDYAAGGDPLGNFDRVSGILAMYPGLQLSDPMIIAMVYMLKQLDAVLWIKSNKHEAQIQGIDERLADISIYSKIMRCMEQSKITENDID